MNARSEGVKYIKTAFTFSSSFLPFKDDIQCTKCPPRQWSTFRSTSCIYPTYEYLAWSSFESVALILAGLLLLSCQAAMGILFFQHRATPLLKALGGPLCALGLMSLMGSCISMVLYLGQPNDTICRIQILLYVMFPTVALSTILAISMQVSLTDKDSSICRYAV